MGLMGGGKFVARTCINLLLIVQICQICLPSHGETDVRVNLVTPQIEMLTFEDCNPKPRFGAEISLREPYTSVSRPANLTLSRADRAVRRLRQAEYPNCSSLKQPVAPSTINSSYCLSKIVAETRSATYYVNVKLINSSLMMNTLGPLMRRGDKKKGAKIIDNKLEQSNLDEAAYEQAEKRMLGFLANYKPVNMLSKNEFMNKFSVARGDFISFYPNYTLYMKDSYLLTCHDVTGECRIHVIIDDLFHGCPQENQYLSPLSTFHAFRKRTEDSYYLMVVDLTGRLITRPFKFNPPELDFQSDPTLIPLGAISPPKTKPQVEKMYTDIASKVPNFDVWADRLRSNLHKTHIESIYYEQSGNATDWVYDTGFRFEPVRSSNGGKKGEEGSRMYKPETVHAAHHYVSSNGKRYHHEVILKSNGQTLYNFKVDDFSELGGINNMNIPSDIIGFNSPKCNKTITLYDFVYTIHNYDERIDKPTIPMLLKGLRFKITAAVTLDDNVYFFAGYNTLVTAPISMPDKCNQVEIDWSKAQESTTQTFIDIHVYKTEPDLQSIINTERDILEGKADFDPPMRSRIDADQTNSIIIEPKSKTKTATVIIIIAVIVIVVIIIAAIYFLCMPFGRQKARPAKPRKSSRNKNRNTNTVRSQLSGGGSKINHIGPSQTVSNALGAARSPKSNTSQGRSSKVGSRISPSSLSKQTPSATELSLKSSVNQAGKSTSFATSGGKTSGLKLGSPKANTAKSPGVSSVSQKFPGSATSPKLQKSPLNSRTPSPTSPSSNKSPNGLSSPSTAASALSKHHYSSSPNGSPFKKTP